MFKRLFTAAVIFGAAAHAPPLAAQDPANCFERGRLVEALSSTYNERQTGIGLQSPYQMLELWTSPATGSFTILMTFPDGLSCVMATGSHWQQAMPAPVEGAAG